tara:strand:- start:926 stop:1924 length:999 start_codon:yes stop_codon:yes gene_type:complete
MRCVFFIILLWLCSPIYSQLGGVHVYNFLNLNTSPRILALGGYLASGLDDDINYGIYNPALIHSMMTNTMSLNYTNYFTDISYGDVGYCFAINNKQNIVASIKFIDYGEFIETNEFGQELGQFTASEYLFSVGSNKYFLDSALSCGVSTKILYSSFYELNSLGVLVDIAAQYKFSRKNVSVNFILKNLGYQVIPYYEGNRESLPFEVIFGVSNQLAHMPLRWHLTFQHIETFDLGYDYTAPISSSTHFGYKLLQHVVFGGELLLHQNFTLLFGYNNRKRSEMIIDDRKGMVGFSLGTSFQIKRFKFNYSRTLHHFSGPINSFGIVTNFKKID